MSCVRWQWKAQQEQTALAEVGTADVPLGLGLLSAAAGVFPCTAGNKL